MPNLTELATTAMPKGHGRKGAKAPTKRKPNAPIQSCFALNPSTDLQVGVSSSSNTSVSIHAPTYSESGYWVKTHQHRLLVAPTNPFSPCHLLCLHGLLPHAIQLTPPVEVYTPLQSTSFKETFQFAMGAKEDTRILHHPITLCLQHEEWHTLISPGSSTPQSCFENVYYHCNIHCVKVVWPHFLLNCVVIPSSVSICLLPEHHHFLYVSFGI